jgi:CPA2 family monovalent cation:H+ antiporter-2
LGTLFQILVSVGCTWLIGLAFDWPLPRSILLGFVISLGSTAVVLKVLQERQELDTEVGQDVTGVLLVQDLALVPMLIIINLLGGEAPGPSEVALQIVGGLGLVGLIAWLTIKGTFRLPFARLLRGDPELEVFAAFLLCFGLALVTGLLGLSAAVGAFVAGIVVTAARETHWVHERLESFRVVFVALFFVSVGMLVDLAYVGENWGVILLLVLAAMLTNTFINAGVMRVLGLTWRRSLYAGALLSQIGEFSFVLAAVGLQSGMITTVGYQTAVAVIALTLLVSPFWFSAAKRLFI